MKRRQPDRRVADGADGAAQRSPMRTATSVSLLLVLIGVLIACFGLPNPAATDNPPAAAPGTGAPTRAPKPAMRKVMIAGQAFDLELALTDSQRARGLADRKEIANDGGMLFVFPEPSVHRFWMKRCLVPIDIVYLDADGRIVAMHEMKVEPYDAADYELPGYSSVSPALAALEFKAGTIKRLALKLGDRLEVPLDDLKQRAN